MKFSCDQCSAQYMIADEKVGTRGVKVKCKKCGHIIIVKPLADQTVVDTPAVGDGGAPAEAPAAGGAFDAMFGGGGSPFNQPTQTMSSSELANLAANATPPAAAPPADDGGFGGGLNFDSAPAAKPARASEKEWYVAIDDAQVGPIDIPEIERRWEGAEVDEESLAWKAGMGDWAPIAEIPELAYLVTEKPQRKAKAAAMGAGLASSAAAAGGSLGGTAPAGDSGGWRPSAASALSSLVQDELAGSSKPAAPNIAAQLDMPTFAANDIFAGAAVGKSSSPGFSASAPDPFAGAPAWNIPKPRQTGKIKPVHMALGGMFMVLITLVGVAVTLFLVKPEVFGVRSASSQPQQPQQPQNPPVGIQNDAGAGNQVARPAHEDESKTKLPERKGGVKAKERAHAEEDNSDDEEDTPRKGKGKEKDKGPGDDLFDDDKPKKPAKAKLTMADVKSGFGQNANNLKPCIGAAIKGGELVPGQRYILVLDWSIEPSGDVTGGRLSGPPNVLGTSMPQCFAQKMRQWKFPAFAGDEALAIKNVPLPFTVPQ